MTLVKKIEGEPVDSDGNEFGLQRLRNFTQFICENAVIASQVARFTEFVLVRIVPV